MKSAEQSAQPVLSRGYWLLILGFWTFMGLLESSKAYVTLTLRGGNASFANALIGNMPWWYFWALATPFAFALARRFPLDRHRALRSVPVHLVASAAFTLVHVLVIGFLYYHTHAKHQPQPPVYLFMVRNWIDNFGMLNFMTYGAIVGAWHLLVFQAGFRASQMNAARLEVEAAQLESRMTEARLSALRMELNPHFLFNALNAIAGLVRRRDNDAAVQVLARLGDLLRITLDREATNRVPLEQELLFLHHYLEIERIRFHDRLDVAIDVDQATRSLLVPTLILQPLVENAVRHGIARKPGSGRIRIEARVRGESLILGVSDTGIGFGPRGIAGIEEGVGLSNTRARLSQLYGERSDLGLETNDAGGATVTVRLPIESAAEPAAERTLAVEAV